MRVRKYWPAVLFIVLLATGKPAFAEDVKRTETVNWAKRIVVDFLQTTTTEYPIMALGLVSPELARVMPREESRERNIIKVLHWGYDKHEIVGTEIAPDASEIVFSIIVRAKADYACRDADMTIRVAKEAGGRWSIRFVSMKEREAPKP